MSGTGFIRGRKGFVVRDGRLYEFRRDRVSVSEAWPPLRYEKTRLVPTWHCGRCEDIPFSQSALNYSLCVTEGDGFDAVFYRPERDGWPSKWLSAMSKFYEVIPAEARRLMGALRKTGRRVDSARWNICALCARSRDGAQMMRESAAIGFMLANLPVFRYGVKRRWNMARMLLGKRRRDILGYLGWQPSEMMVRILSKIPIGECNSRTLLMLRTTLLSKPDISRRISHFRTLNGAVLDLLTSKRRFGLVSWGLLDELSQMEEINAYLAVGTLNEIIAIQKEMRIPQRKISSLDQMRKLYVETLDLSSSHSVEKALKLPDFPPAPFHVPEASDSFEIRPISTPASLLEEGRQQRNCVYSYLKMLYEPGCDMYFYSLIKPERATVKLKKTESGGYLVAEIKGKCNSIVSDSTVMAVEAWLREFSENPSDSLPLPPISIME